MSATAKVPSTRRTTHTTGAVRVGGLRGGGVRGGGRSVPVRPELRLVTGPLPSRARAARPPSRRAPFVLLVLALLVATTVALLVLNTAIAVDSLKAGTLRRENAKKVEQVQLLQRQVITGSTPQELAAAAASAGLVPAGNPGHLVVEPDGSSTLRGTPSPAPSAPAPAPPTAASPAPAAPAPAAPSDAAAGD